MGAISRSTVGDRTSEDLRWLEALGVAWSCRMPRFGQFRDLPVDGRWDDRSLTLIRSVTTQIMGRPFDYVPASVVAWLRANVGNDVDSLVRRCRVSEPSPEEPTPTPQPSDPQPDPTPTPRPEPSGVDSVRRMVIINQSPRTDTEISRWTDAVKEQIDKHVAPHYGGMELRFAADGQPQPGEWVHVVLGTPDGNYGGYHTVSQEWEPVAYTFTETSLPGSVVLSHEALEVLVNPMVGEWQSLGQGRFVWKEICDPVQRIWYRMSNGIQVSDFVLPAWFGDYGEAPDELHAAARYADYSVVTQANQIPAGGYMGVLDASTNRIEFVSDLRAAISDAGMFSPGAMMGAGCEIRAIKRRIQLAGV